MSAVSSCSPRPIRARATPGTRRAASPRRWGVTTRRTCTRAIRSRPATASVSPRRLTCWFARARATSRELIEWGATFDQDQQGQPALGREAAHSVRRVLHVRDATGRRIGRVLWQMVSTHPRVQVFGDALALSLSTPDGTCGGATFLDRDGRRGAGDREPDTAGHWRRGPGVSRDDESRHCHRRRDRDGASRPGPA